MEQEADYVAAEVNKKLREGIPPEEIAIIFRTVQDASITITVIFEPRYPLFYKGKGISSF